MSVETSIQRSNSSSLANTLWVIVPAAGVGRRMGGVRPKQYLPLGNKTIIQHTLDRLLSFHLIKHIWMPVSDEDPYWPKLQVDYQEQVTTVSGGLERADSVLNALNAINAQAHDDDWVLVHDAARPCIRIKDLAKLIAELANDKVGGLLAVLVADTLKRSDANNQVESTVDRSLLWRAYTPQMFRFGLLYRGLQDAQAQAFHVTDEASAIEFLGYKPRLIEGHGDNIKITHPLDLPLANLFLERIYQEEA